MAAPGVPPATVLVADDDPLVRTVLRMALSGLGHRVIEARDATEIAIVDPGTVVDLAIVDINMPGGSIVDNLDALAARSVPPRVLMLSGDDAPAPEIAARVDRFARKPLDLADFTAVVDGLLSDLGKGGRGHDRH